MPDGPERNEARAARCRELVAAYAPWKLHAYRIENMRRAIRGSIGYKYNTFNQHPWQYHRHRHASGAVGEQEPPMTRSVAAALAVAAFVAARCTAQARRSGPTRRRSLRVRASRSPRPASIRRRRQRPLLEPRQVARSSSRSTSTTTSRGRTSSCRTPRRRCPRSPPTARRGRSASSRASTSPTTRRSRARSASSPPHDYVYSFKRLARPEDALAHSSGSSTASSPALDEALGEGEGGRASSTTTRRSRACRRSTATRCSSSSTSPTTRFLPYLTHDADRRRRARGDRGVRRRERLGDGQSGRHRAVPAQGVAARRRRSCSRRIPDYRDETFPALPANADADRELVAAMKGKRLPQVGRVEISIIEESNPRLLAFNSGELDYVNVPRDLVAQRARRRATAQARRTRSRA